jgi:hypothetical protein
MTTTTTTREPRESSSLKTWEDNTAFFAQQKLICNKGGLDTTRVNHMGVSTLWPCHYLPCHYLHFFYKKS